MTDHWVAAADFIAIHPDGRRDPLSVRIGMPQAVGPNEWSCDVALEGLYGRIGPMRGGDALQALGLAWRLAGELLTAFETQGGRLEFDGGDPVPLSAYFGSASDLPDRTPSGDA